MREAEKEGFHPIQAIVRGFDRAHYYPGRKESTLKVIADKKTGRILGGQAIGEGPSDKFMDILAMALHGKMTCQELASVGSGLCTSIQPGPLSDHCGSQCVHEQIGGEGQRNSSFRGERET